MDQEKYTTLISRLEVYSREHATAYKIRVALLAAFGFLYLFVAIVLLLLLIVALLAYVGFNWLVLKIIWLPIVLVGIVLRSLWVDFPDPDGQHLKYEGAPALFDLVRGVESALHSPHVHHILLVDEFNAAVVQIPRLGIFGWQKNYLLVGLPLMQSLTPEQFYAVIAHELGHLSGAHSRFDGWIYRVRQTWLEIVVSLQEKHRHGAVIFEIFLSWYAPFFSAYSFVLARAQEYEADAQAAELAGKEHAAKALTKFEIKNRFLAEDFWAKFYRQADAQSDAPDDVFTQYVAASKSQVPNDAARKWFLSALAVETGHEDTHPSLADRLTAIGYPVTSADAAEYRNQLLSSTDTNEQSAAQFYLGQLADDYIPGRNRWWNEQVRGVWRERHRSVREAKERGRELQTKAEGQPLTRDERWELVRCLADTQGDEAALPMVRAIASANPDDVVANFVLGQMLLAQEDDAGIEFIEKAMTLEPDTTFRGCEMLYLFLRERERDNEAETYRVRAKQHNTTILTSD